MANVLDLVSGLYRRLYAGFIKAKRINQISLEAEAWFWRVHAAADDFGNAERDPQLVYAATVGRRKGVTVEQVDGWLTEMERANLIMTYDVADERYLHVIGFIHKQPAGKNGRRIRRYPESPLDVTELSGLPQPPGGGESGGIRGNPSAYEDENEDEDENENDDEDDRAVVVALLTQEKLQDDPIAAHPNATGERVRIAIENANAHPNLRNRKAFICTAIRESHALSANAKRRRDRETAATKRAGAQRRDDAEADRLKRETADALAAVRELPDAKFAELCERVYAAHPKFRRFAKPEKSNMAMAVEVFRLLKQEPARESAA